MAGIVVGMLLLLGVELLLLLMMRLIGLIVIASSIRLLLIGHGSPHQVMMMVCSISVGIVGLFLAVKLLLAVVAVVPIPRIGSIIGSVAPILLSVRQLMRVRFKSRLFFGGDSSGR